MDRAKQYRMEYVSHQYFNGNTVGSAYTFLFFLICDKFRRYVLFQIQKYGMFLENQILP